MDIQVQQMVCIWNSSIGICTDYTETAAHTVETDIPQIMHASWRYVHVIATYSLPLSQNIYLCYCSGHQLNATEGHSTISLYTGWDYTDFTALAHIPLRPPNDYYPLSDILSSGQALEGSHINILAIVRHVSLIHMYTCMCVLP